MAFVFALERDTMEVLLPTGWKELLRGLDVMGALRGDEDGRLVARFTTDLADTPRESEPD